MKHESQPILIIKNFDLSSWKRIEEDIYLDKLGNIYCDSFLIKDYRDRRCKRWYYFIKEYLDKKRRKYDATGIKEVTLGDLRSMMWNKDIKSISRKRIEEIVHWENQIAKTRNEILKRARKYIVGQIYKRDRIKNY